MDGSEYKSDYDFVKKRKAQQTKLLKIMVIVFPVLIVFVLLFSVVSNFSVFKPKTDKVNQVFQEDPEVKRLQQLKTLEDAYKNASIPYSDPQKRFTIIFETSYPSDQIAVVINSEKDYDSVKAQADKIIESAKEKVTINSVTYIDMYKNK